MSDVKLNMLEAGNSSGNLAVDSSLLKIVPDRDTPNGNMVGYVDKTGTLTINIPGYGEVKASGFLSKDDIGRGPDGQRGSNGQQGYDGSIGLDGAKGFIGDRGKSGDRGIPGVRGPRGKQGKAGEDGALGTKGIEGDDAVTNVFIQEADPGAPGAGAVWVKPLYPHMQTSLDDIQAVCDDDETHPAEETS